MDDRTNIFLVIGIMDALFLVRLLYLISLHDERDLIDGKDGWAQLWLWEHRN